MPPLEHSVASAPRSHDRESGFVMLVVMVILLVATASAAVAIQATMAELRSAGQERQAVQTRYVAEAGLMTTLAYLDMTANSADMVTLKERAEFPNLPPAMHGYAEPEYSFNPVTGKGGTRHGAFRLTSTTQRNLYLQAAVEIDAISVTAAGGGPAPPPSPFVDPYGSLGPGQAYSALDGAFHSYVADINDCIDVKNATAGNEVQHAATIVLHCTITIRARTQFVLTNPLGTMHNWNLAGTTFSQNPFTTAHDMRASVTLPPMLTK